MTMGCILGRKAIKHMKQVKEERRYLQRIREELIKVEKQHEQSTLKQYHGKVYYISFITVKNLSFIEFMLFTIYYFTVMV